MDEKSTRRDHHVALTVEGLSGRVDCRVLSGHDFRGDVAQEIVARFGNISAIHPRTDGEGGQWQHARIGEQLDELLIGRRTHSRIVPRALAIPSRVRAVAEHLHVIRRS